MVTYADPKSKTTDPRPGVTVSQSNKGSGATVAYIIAAIVVVVGAYLLFFSDNISTTPVVPSVTQNNTVTPAPETPAPVTPAPDAATPPAMETAPAAPAPATPPAANQ